MNDTAAPNRNRWFIVNVAVLCVLAPWATYWFQRHLQLYFTEIVVVGGALSLWVVLRAMWAMFEKTTDVDAIGYSRRFLSSPDLTILLIVAVVVFAVLWFRTASLYVQYQGAPGEGEYLVEVVRKSDNSPLINSVATNAGHPVIGGPYLWQSETSELECRILRPVKYETLPCVLEPGRSTRIIVPGSFTPREFHLLRLVPGGSLFRDLAAVDATPQTRFDLEMKRGADVAVLEDLRRQTVYTGTAESEMPILMELEEPGTLQQHLLARMQAHQVDADSAAIATATLTSATRQWPTFYLRSGDVLELTARIAQPHDGGAAPEIAEHFPIRYTVTGDKVQTLWLPSD